MFRWVKFEEDVEEGGNRWSKPHVATLSLHSLFELRSFLLNGSGKSSFVNKTIGHLVDVDRRKIQKWKSSEFNVR